MSIVLAVEILPIALLGIPSGALIAKLGARTTMVLCDAARGVLTTRTPDALRPKAMTGLITLAMLAGPIGLLVVGPLLAEWGPRRVLLFVAFGQFLASLPFAFVALRGNRREAPVPAEAA